MSETEDTISLVDHLVLDLILVLILTHFRSICPEVFYKKGVFRILQNSQESTCPSVSFLIKLRALGLQL